jgi:hypothetical protein
MLVAGGQALAPTLRQITDSLVIIEDDVNKLTAEVQQIKVSRPLTALGDGWSVLVVGNAWGQRGLQTTIALPRGRAQTDCRMIRAEHKSLPSDLCQHRSMPNDLCQAQIMEA